MTDMTDEGRPPVNCRLLVTAAGSVVACHRTESPCSPMCPHMEVWDGGGLFSCADPELKGSPVMMMFNDDLAHPWKAPRFAESHQCCGGACPSHSRRQRSLVLCSKAHIRHKS